MLEPRNIPPHMVELGLIENFTKLFFQLCTDYGTYERAYEAAERLHVQYFEVRRFKNYESFRIARTRYQNKISKKN